MRDFLSLNKAERLSLIMTTADAMGISPLLIEKDFWVCFVLRHLFSLEVREDIIFKGGTSLSKAFGIIQRFSEDIDITIDKRKLGYEHIKSKNKLSRHLENLTEGSKKYIEQNILSKLTGEFFKTLGKTGWEIKADGPLNARFYYPSLIKLPGSDYFKQSVLIEFGIRGEMEPHEIREINSYIQEFHGTLLKEPLVKLRVLSPLRTFWEKITLIHAENHRPQEKQIPDRLSRHYYDIFQLTEKGVSEKALKEISLLHDVIHHKTIFFRSAWASYETAVPQTIVITPNKNLQTALSKDYKMTQQMIFGIPPRFEDIMKNIKKLEILLHAMKD